MNSTKPEMNEDFSDWMSIHDISINELTIFKSIFPPQPQLLDKSPANTTSGYSKEEAWKYCATALVNLLPEHKEIIYKIRDAAPRCLSPREGKTKRPYTIDQGVEKHPYISCYYGGSISDLTSLSHEFSHAVQIVVSRDNSNDSPFMPPLYRECCAFLGEIAVTEYFEKENPKTHELLKKTWFNDNLKYLAKDVDEFKLALYDCKRTYSYNWNYPIARLYAVFLWKNRVEDGNTISSLFSSGGNANNIIPIKALSLELNLFNPLPTIYQHNKDASDSFNQSFILGIITALYISDYKQNKQSITEFHERISKHLKNNCFIIYYIANKPAAYACWNKKNNIIIINELSFPFCRLKEFRGFIRKQLNLEIQIPSHLIREDHGSLCT